MTEVDIDAAVGKSRSLTTTLARILSPGQCPWCQGSGIWLELNWDARDRPWEPPLIMKSCHVCDGTGDDWGDPPPISNSREFFEWSAKRGPVRLLPAEGQEVVQITTTINGATTVEERLWEWPGD